MAGPVVFYFLNTHAIPTNSLGVKSQTYRHLQCDSFYRLFNYCVEVLHPMSAPSAIFNFEVGLGGLLLTVGVMIILK